MEETPEDKTQYLAVVNHEEQYSIWPIHKEIPPGWREAGKHGSRQEVLKWIGQIWTDMRPLSVRRQMEKSEQETAEGQ